MENKPAVIVKAAIAKDTMFQASPTKEPDYSGFGKHDFVINGEITVTITLSEYRQLLTAQAKAEASEANSKVYSMKNELEALKKELAAANKQIAEFRALIQVAAAKKEDKTNE